MVIFLQFALVDIRSLVGFNKTLLTSPSWPSPMPYTEFMRGSGQIIPRNKKGIDNWIGENFICNINRGIRIDDKINLEDIDVCLKNVSKHQYSSENYILTKYEFVFISLKKGIELDYIKIQRIISSIFQSKIKIRNADFSYSSSSFERATNLIKNFHLVTSTKQSKINLKSQISLIKECSPQIYFYLNSNEKLKTSGKIITSISEEAIHPFSMYGFWHNYNNKAVRVWIQQKKMSFSNTSFERELRISFLRFHSEYESLKIVFKNINEGKIKINSLSNQSQILQNYLNRAISTILKSEVNTTYKNSTGLVDYFKSLFTQFQPGELVLLKEKIQELNFRPQIVNKTINFIDTLIVTYNQDMKITQKIKDSQVLVQENHAAVHNNFNYGGTLSVGINYEALKKELILLREEIANHENGVERAQVNQDLIQIEEATQKKDPVSLLKHLQSCGQWLLDVATKITIPIIVELIKTQAIGKP